MPRISHIHGYEIADAEARTMLVKHNNRMDSFQEEDTARDRRITDLENVSRQNDYMPNAKHPPHGYTPAMGDGVTDDTQAIQRLIDDFNEVYLPRGTYRTTDSINCHNAKITGAHSEKAFIKLDTADYNKPVITAGQTAIIESIGIGFKNLPGGINSDKHFVGIRLSSKEGASFQRGSVLRNLLFWNVGTAICDFAEQSAFNASFENLEITKFSWCGISMMGGGTGNVFSNIYINGNMETGDYYENATAAQFGGHMNLTLNQFNVEHMHTYCALLVKKCYNLSASAIHLEGVKLRNGWCGMVQFDRASGVIDGMSFIHTFHNNAPCAALIQLGESAGFSSEVYGRNDCKIIINRLTCIGLGTPDGNLYPNSGEVGFANANTPVMLYRQDSASGSYTFGINEFTFASYLSDEDASKYDSFPMYDGTKIRVLNLGNNDKYGPTENRPTTRLIANRTKYFDSTLNQEIMWNGSEWV